MAKRGWIYFAVAGFVLGVIISEFGFDSFRNGFFVITAILLLALVARPKPVIILLFILCASMALGYLRSSSARNDSLREVIFDQHVNKNISFVGLVSEEQERREFNTRIYVKVLEFDGGKYEEDTEILLTTSNPRDFRYGEIVEVTGKLIKPENFFTDTGREFDYVGYLEAKNIRFMIRNAVVEFRGYDPPSRVLSTLFWAKREFVFSISKMLPEPQSSLASGILIDGKQSINGELQEKFRKTGLVHIVVLSGYNVSIIAEAISRVFMFLPRTLGLMSSIVGIVAFAAVTGASATVVRASIMAVIVILSRISLRNYDPCRGLFLASFVMLIHNPEILFHSPSFQLSFLATYAVVKIVPLLETKVKFLPEKFGIRELVTSNIIVQLYLFPMLSWMTGLFSIVSLPVNLLVLPFMPITMLMSFLTAITGFFGRIVSFPFALSAQGLLSYELMVVDFFSSLSFAELSLGSFSGYVVVGFYTVSLVVFMLLKRSR